MTTFISWHEFKDRLKRYFLFNKLETREFFLVVLFFALILSFDDWGIEKFNLVAGFKNFFIAFCIVAVSVFLHHAVQRCAALYFGYRPEQRIWWLGILISLILLIFSNGKVMVFAGCYIMTHMLTSQRIGKHRYGPSIRTLGYIAMFGPLANFLFAGILHTINLSLNSPVLTTMVGFNILFAIYNIIPIPPLDGAKMLFASRLAYAFFFAAVAGYLALVYALGVSILFALFVAILCGIIGWIVFYLMFERYLV